MAQGHTTDQRWVLYLGLCLPRHTVPRGVRGHILALQMGTPSWNLGSSGEGRTKALKSAPSHPSLAATCKPSQ